MARVGNPWRAMALASVFALVACEPGVGITAPVTGAASPDASVATDVKTMGELQHDTPVTAVVGSGLESLVVMTAPASTDGVIGAGCSPEPGEDLADGDWFGFVLGANTRELHVDIACVYGPDTDQFAAYSSMEDSSWGNYVVVNDVVEERAVRYRSTAQAYLAADDWSARLLRDTVASPGASTREGSRGVWLRVEDGYVTAVVQPYTSGVGS